MKRGRGMKGVKYRNGQRLAPEIAVPEAGERWAVMCAYGMQRRNFLTRTARGVVGTCDHCGQERVVELVNVSSELTSTGIYRLADLVVRDFPTTFGLWCRSCRNQTPAAVGRRRQAKRAPARQAAKRRASAPAPVDRSPTEVADTKTAAHEGVQSQPSPQGRSADPAHPSVDDGHRADDDEDLIEFEREAPEVAARIRARHGELVSARRECRRDGDRLVSGWRVWLADGRSARIERELGGVARA